MPPIPPERGNYGSVLFSRRESFVRLAHSLPGYFPSRGPGRTPRENDAFARQAQVSSRRARPAKARSGLAVLSGIAVLSTCNRLEVYAVSGGKSFQDLIDFASESTGVQKSESFPWRRAERTGKP